MERLGKKPDPEKAPLEIQDFPPEVQYAFLIHSLMSDTWDGMNGVYMGKDWAALGILLDIFKIDNKQQTVHFIKYIEHFNTQQINDKSDRQRKRAETKTPPGTKTVKG